MQGRRDRATTWWRRADVARWTKMAKMEVLANKGEQESERARHELKICVNEMTATRDNDNKLCARSPAMPIKPTAYFRNYDQIHSIAVAKFICKMLRANGFILNE